MLLPATMYNLIAVRPQGIAGPARFQNGLNPASNGPMTGRRATQHAKELQNEVIPKPCCSRPFTPKRTRIYEVFGLPGDSYVVPFWF